MASALALVAGLTARTVRGKEKTRARLVRVSGECEEPVWPGYLALHLRHLAQVQEGRLQLPLLLASNSIHSPTTIVHIQHH